MTALCIIPVLLSRHIKEFTDLHIEASASGCSDLLLCHGSYPFFNTVFPRDTTDQVTSCMSLLSPFKGLRIQGSDLFFKDFYYKPSSITFHLQIFFLLHFCNIINMVFLNHKFIIHFECIYQKLKVGRRGTTGSRYGEKCQIRDLKKKKKTRPHTHILLYQ